MESFPFGGAYGRLGGGRHFLLALHFLKPPNPNMQEKPMSARAFTIIALGAASIALAAVTPQLAKSAPERIQLGALGANEGIYVDVKGFSVVRGAAKADPTVQLMKLGAQEVKDGAIIVRAGDKLYLVDTDPSAKSLYSGWAQDAFSGATP